ncbi:11353_t:CDS:2, partial [Gigaspora rosea]
YEQEDIFEKLKKKLTTALILVHPYDKEQFILCTDVLHVAPGAVLSQLDNEEKENPVEYTNHSALTYMNNITNPTRRMAGYLMILQGYNFIIKYKPSWQILNVDGLLRVIYDPGRDGAKGKKDNE